MKFTTVWRTIAALMLCAVATPTLALDGSVPGINGDDSRALLGDGTGVVVGIVDSGVDDTHPALAGFDSLGNLRMVAEKNFAADGGLSADDVAGHGTRVASAVMSRDQAFTGMAPDARFINARVLNNSNSFPNDTPVRDGLGYAIDQGADIINMSLNYFGQNSFGNSQLDLMVDWAAYDRRISTTITVGNIQNGDGTLQVRGPGSAFNGITVGRTTDDFSRVQSDSATAFTADGRMKPDVVAPGTNLTLANARWETQADWITGSNGTSFAAPHVAGLMAQQLEAGAVHGLSTDPLVVKATILNSAAKVLDKQGNAWQQAGSSNVGGVYSTSQPLDNHSGAGQIDGLTLSNQYLPGEMAPGLVDAIGWDFNTISRNQFIDYVIDPNLIFGSTLNATLTWYRHVSRTDDGNGLVDSGDFFAQSQSMVNLGLQILRNGALVAQSSSTVDNVEHLHLGVDTSAQYTLRVLRPNTPFTGPEEFALAWYGVAVPEPASVMLIVVAALCAACRRRR